MAVKKIEDPTEVKVARAAGRLAARAVKTGHKTMAAATAFAQATRLAAGKIADRVKRKAKPAKPAVAALKPAKPGSVGRKATKSIGRKVKAGAKPVAAKGRRSVKAAASQPKRKHKA
jgi:hypothetical protein